MENPTVEREIEPRVVLDLRSKVFAELRALSADTERPKPRSTLD